MRNNKKGVGKLVKESMTWKKEFVFMSRKKLRSWHAISIILFVSGILTATILMVVSDIEQKTKAATGSAKLSWTANSESDLGGYKLYYGTSKRSCDHPDASKCGYASVIDVHNVTSYTVDNLTEGHAYYFSLTAYDKVPNPNESDFSTEVSKTVPATDSTAPLVSITNPLNNATVSGTVIMTANATDNIGVAKVEFYVDGAMKSSDSNSPYSYSFDSASVSDGNHQFSARAYDIANNVGNSTMIVVNVDNSAQDTISPEVSIVSPANNASVSGTVEVLAKVTDQSTGNQNAPVSKVELYVDGTKILTDSSTPYSFALDTLTLIDASHELLAKAYISADGSDIVSSAVVVIKVNNGPAKDGIAPIVTISKPTDGATVSGILKISAYATDNSGVRSMTCYVDGIKISSSGRSSINCYWWITGKVSTGSHTIKVEAVDAIGKVGSRSINVNVAKSIFRWFFR